MKLTALLIITFGLLIYCKPSSATTITFSGIVVNGSDKADLFGGGNLAGDSITLSFSYDLSQTTASPEYNGGVLFADAYIPVNPGVITASVTIGASSVSSATACLTGGCGGNAYYCLVPIYCNGYVLSVTANGSVADSGFVGIVMYSAIPATSLTDSTALANSFFDTPGGDSGQVQVCTGTCASTEVLTYDSGSVVSIPGGGIPGGGGSSTPEPGPGFWH